RDVCLLRICLQRQPRADTHFQNSCAGGNLEPADHGTCARPEKERKQPLVDAGESVVYRALVGRGVFECHTGSGRMRCYSSFAVSSDVWGAPLGRRHHLRSAAAGAERTKYNRISGMASSWAATTTTTANTSGTRS